MSTIFEVTDTDIARLTADQLTKLLKKILHLEARAANIPESGISVGLNINAPDGGEDGRIEWGGDPPKTNFLPSRLVIFQNKATEMGPAKYAEEVVKDGKLKPRIEQVLSNDGHYIFFTTQALNQQQKEERFDAIRNQLNKSDKHYADNIKIYDAATIQGWVNRFIPAIVAVSYWADRTLVPGLCTWDEWEKSAKPSFDFVSDPVRNEIMENIREILSQPKQCARITGLSGLGKTRLALEICRGDDNTSGFKERVVYFDAACHQQNLSGSIYEWVRSELDGLLVIDNCDLELHTQVRRITEHSDSKISLLTLHYDPEKDSDTRLFQLKPIDDESIKSMLKSFYGDRITDLDRITEFAQGFPQMAVLLAQSRLDPNAIDMGSLTDDYLVKRMLWGDSPPNDTKKNILEACALFDVFGIEDEAEAEAKFIAESVAMTDIDTLYGCIQEFKNRGIVNQVGRFAQIIPKPLAIRLAADWWGNARLEKQKELVRAEMPGRLKDNFCNQIAKLDFLPKVKELVESLCGPPAPFGQAEVILSSRGSYLFRSFVEVNPNATSNALFRILSSLTREQLKNISGDVRRNLVWALEKLCFHKEVFDKSTECLMWLAAAENETWVNNASGQFRQLFRVFLSGTAATLEQRLTFLGKALKSTDIHIRKLLVKTLGSSIGVDRGSRMRGAEYQGSGKPLEEWVPKIWQEVFDYWNELLSMLTELVLHDKDVGDEAKDAIGNKISDLMRYGSGIMQALDIAIQKIVAAQDTLWVNALNSIKDSILYDSEKMPQEGKNKLNEWIKLLSPTKIEDRIQLVVSNPKHEAKKGKDGHYINLTAVNAQELATELSEDLGTVIGVMRLLLEGNQIQGYTFGQQLAKDTKDSADKKLLIDAAISTIKELKNPNTDFLVGMLKGTYETDMSLWLEYEALFKHNVDLVKHYAEIIQTGKITKRQLDTYLSLMGKGSIPAENASAFCYRGALKHISPEIITRFIENYYTLSADAAWIALDILTMYCDGDEDIEEECKKTFKSVLSSLCLRRENMQNSMSSYHWKEKIEDILEDGDAEFAKKIMQQIIISIADKHNLGISNNSVESVTRELFSTYGVEVWPIVAKAIRDAEPHERYRLSLFLKASSYIGNTSPRILAELDEQILKDWYVSEPEIAPEFVASIIDFYTNSDEISPQAKFLLDNYGEHEEVLNALIGNAGSFSCSGSLVPMYEQGVKAMGVLLDHSIPSVKEWAQSRIAYLERRIGEEKQRDEEGRLNIC